MVDLKYRKITRITGEEQMQEELNSMCFMSCVEILYHCRGVTGLSLIVKQIFYAGHILKKNVI